MTLSELSIKRPIFVSCLVIIMLVLGYVAMRTLGVELFPDVSPPVVSVTTLYPGTGAREIENLVTKPIEDSVSTIAGLKRVTSQSIEGVSLVVCEFYMEEDIKQAEQRVRDKVAEAKIKFPKDTKEPVVQPLNFSDQPIVTVALTSELPESQVYDLADKELKSRFQQLRDVGKVNIVGGRKREIQVLLDREKVKARGLSAGFVASRLADVGANIPAGKIQKGEEENVFRSRGEFNSTAEIGETVISLFGNENPTKVKDVGHVIDGLEKEKNRSYLNGKKSLVLEVYKQSKTNTVAVSKLVQKELPKLEKVLQAFDPQAKLEVVRDGAREISLNIFDVQESILLGILLTVIVVFLFLGNFRSTIITGLALPNSLLGAFILMQVFGLSINIVTLLGLSLVVGLLVDDAIVVRENIFRYLERGFSPEEAARKGTAEVTLAVIATSLVVISVFGPIALTTGLIGKILANFGLTICFAMVISLFDALTIAPMLSAYFAGKGAHGSKGNIVYRNTLGLLVRGFDAFQSWLERVYARVIDFVIRLPLVTLGISVAICVFCFGLTGSISTTFIPAQDAGEFSVLLELPQGSHLSHTGKVAAEIDKIVRAIPEVAVSSLMVGGNNGEPEKASFYVRLKDFKERDRRTADIKEEVRQKLVPFAEAKPKVQDYDFTGGGFGRPFMLNILSNDFEQLIEYSGKVLEAIKKDPRFKDVDTTYREGKKEYSFELAPGKASVFGMNTTLLGSELRAQVEGIPATVFREKGLEYDVRVLMEEDARDVRADLDKIYLMNLNNKLIRLSDVAKIQETKALASIDRQNRNRYIQISADLAPNVGIGDIVSDYEKKFKEGDLKIPQSLRYAFIGDSENFEDLAQSMVIVLTLAILFIYLVLSSLYESFITPFTILLTLPLALSGAFVALFLTKESINLFSGLGMLMLMGVSCKNAILLVDFVNQKLKEGVDVKDAIRQAGVARLRPILMTSLALIAGTIPIAIGLNEASSQRVSMGIGIIGGTISSTILSLVVVPALLPYVLVLSRWAGWLVAKVGGRS